MYFIISIIIIKSGIAIIIPIKPNNNEQIIIDEIVKVCDNLLVFLYIFGVIKYASILGNIIDIIDVNISNFLLITDAVISAIELVNKEPIIGINEFIELSIASNK